MSLITNLIDQLRANGSALCAEAANMIEELSAKLFASQMERSSMYYHDGWIPCSERMPEEHEWIGTNRFGTTISAEVYVTFENPKGERFTEHLSFQNGKLSSFDQRKIDAFYKGSVPIAWMPLPEPYKESKK